MPNYKKNGIKEFFKKIPFIANPYRWVRDEFKKIRDIWFDFQAKYWAKKDLEDIRAHWLRRNDHKTNGFLVPFIKKYNPNNVLEIGCNCGNKLYYLSKCLPETKFTGIDINPLAISKGKEWLKEEKIENIELILGRAERLYDFKNNSFDVVFSFATLIYVRPSKIEKVIKDMLRIAIKAMVLFEMQAETTILDRNMYGIYFAPNWKRDYQSIVKKINIPIKDIKVSWIPQEVWHPHGGGAAVIEVIKENK